ncbi:MAG: 1-acyl-sn-glycerol-3-phosphate acyltransferase [Phycisphaerae bacterium]|nr:1-acyl-sn-glycerol-3-phosphate acyltransferase [Phycisphaerae bacterium]
MFESLRRKQPDRSLPRLLFYELACAVVRTIISVFWSGKSFHSERVPANGPLLLASNHQSYLDPPLIAVRLRHRHVNFIAKAGLFKFRPFAWTIAWLNSVPIRGDASDTAAIKEVVARLERGESVLIFPEGARTPNGTIAPFKRGVSLLVKKARCTVVPVAVEGVFDVWPNSRSLPRLFGRRMYVMYGTPIAYEELMKHGADEALGRLGREIDAMRMELRANLRRDTKGRCPAPGPADQPITWPSARTNSCHAPSPAVSPLVIPSAGETRTGS